MTRVWGRYVAVVLLSSVCMMGSAEERSTTRMKKSSGRSAASKEVKLTGRLPRHFASLVDAEQRARIYEIQSGYREQLEELAKELAALEMAQMKDVEGVLTTAQRKTLGELRNAGPTRTKGKSESKAGSKPSTSTKSSSKKSSAKVATKSSATKKPTTPTTKTRSRSSGEASEGRESAKERS